jgi:hypothetical protein
VKLTSVVALCSSIMLAAAFGSADSLTLSGTAVLLLWRKDRLLIASDSRGTKPNLNQPNAASHEDNDCKIDPMSKTLIFVSSGVRLFQVNLSASDGGFSANVDWDSHEMAQTAFQTISAGKDSQVEPGAVAEAWNRIAEDKLNAVPFAARETLRAKSHVTTTRVMFAGLRADGTPDVWVSKISNDSTHFIATASQPPMDEIYSMAEGGELVKEFSDATSERSHARVLAFNADVKDQTADEIDASRLAQFIRWMIEFYTGDSIGGVPEEVSLRKGGTIEWLHECPHRDAPLHNPKLVNHP